MTRDGRALDGEEFAGRRVSIDAHLAQAFAAMTHRGRGGRDRPAARPPPPKFYVELFVPIHGTTNGSPIGEFDVYVNARPIDDAVELTRRDVFVIALGHWRGLLGLLWLAFSGASRRLSSRT